MAYGGGYWNYPIQNKKMPGVYFYFSSKAQAPNEFGERGFVAMALDLPWGKEGELITVEPSDLQKDSLGLFGVEYTDPALMPLREMLKNAHTAYIYRLNSDGTKATGTEGEMNVESLYSGVGGNDTTISVSANIDNPEQFDVEIRKQNKLVYEKTVTDITGLEDNGYVTFSGNLSLTAGLTLTGGENGTSTVTSHTNFLELLESVFINTVAYAGEDESIKRLYESFVTRRVTQEGAYFQGVLFNHTADSELIINVNTSTEEEAGGLVYWVAGLQAGTAINRTAGSRKYDGELTPVVKTKQRDLQNAIDNGEFVLHRVDKDYLVLADINSFTSFELYKNSDYSKNQVMRVLHQIGNDWTTIFVRYFLDKVQNGEIERTELWNAFHNHLLKLFAARAITNLESEDLIVELGDTKDAVYTEVAIQPILAMNKLYNHIMVA